MMLLVLLAAAGYLLGSVTTAVVVSRALGAADPRAGGSGNPGATNVLRLAGHKAAALTLGGDALKGAAPVAAARMLDLPPEAVHTYRFVRSYTYMVHPTFKYLVFTTCVSSIIYLLEVYMR